MKHILTASESLVVIVYGGRKQVDKGGWGLNGEDACGLRGVGVLGSLGCFPFLEVYLDPNSIKAISIRLFYH